jgi:hypothetical protein
MPASSSAHEDRTCTNGKDAAVNVPITVSGLLHVHVRLLCVNE